MNQNIKTSSNWSELKELIAKNKKQFEDKKKELDYELCCGLK